MPIERLYLEMAAVMGSTMSDLLRRKSGAEMRSIFASASELIRTHRCWDSWGVLPGTRE